MAGLRWGQARLLRSQITTIYGRSYLPLRTGDTTISLGDVLRRKRDTVEILDSLELGVAEDDFVKGNSIDRVITSDSSIDISFKAKGKADTLGFFAEGEAGMGIKFNASNQMFLLVKKMRRKSFSDFSTVRDLVVNAYVTGQVPARSFVVVGLVQAEKYYLAYSGSDGGEIKLSFKSDLPTELGAAVIESDFSVDWTNSIGYYIDAPKGGPLAYRVSKIKCRRHLRSRKMQELIIEKNYTEAESLDMLTLDERKELFDKDALDLTGSTDEMSIEMSEGQ